MQRSEIGGLTSVLTRFNMKEKKASNESQNGPFPIGKDERGLGRNCHKRSMEAQKVGGGKRLCVCG
jgi:hypothetical protein